MQGRPTRSPPTTTSTITPSAASIVADGATTSTITVQLEDANGNNLTASGGTVALATSRGTLSAVTNVGDGTYTATLTSGLTAGTAHITGTLNGSALAQAADVTFAAGAAAKFVVTPASTGPVAGNDVTITAQLADVNGNAVSESGHTAAWSKNCGAGSFSSGTSTTNAGGIATVTFTTPATVGSCTVTATEGSFTGTSGSITSIPGAASAATSTIAVSSGTITANGSSTSTVTVRLKDANGNALVSSGGTVVISKASGTGTLGATTNNGDGTYTATLASPTAVGSATIGATVNGSAITTGNATVSFVAGPAVRYLVSSSSYTATAGAAVIVTAQLVDPNNNPVNAAGRSVAWSSTHGGSFSGATSPTDAGGVATIIFNVSTNAGVGHFVTANDGSATGTTAAINTTPTELSLARSTVACGASTLTADGSSATTCTLQLKDVFANNITASGGTAAMTTTLGSLSGVTDHGDGSYGATLRSSTSNGNAVIRATLNDVAVTNSASVSFVGAAVLARPRLLDVLPADGATLASTAQIALTADHLVTWRDFTVTKNGGTPTTLSGGAGVSILRDFASSGAGLYVIRVTMDDGVNAPVAVVSHFTVPSSTGSEPPAVQKSVDPDHTTVLTTNNLPTLPGSSVSVTLPALGLSEPLELEVAAKRVPAGFGGGVSIDVKVLRSDGSLMTDFSKNPIEIRIDNVSSDFVPYTSSGGSSWRRIGTIPSRVLPDSMNDGAFRNGRTVYIETRHLSYFAVLKPKATAKKLSISIGAAGSIRHNMLTVRASATVAATLKADLYSSKNVHLYAWHFKLRAGSNTLKLKWPSKARKRGTYKIVWLAQANGQITKKTISVRRK